MACASAIGRGSTCASGRSQLNAHLDEYDLGGGISRYSLTREGPAPDVYQTYHRQLLLLLQDVDYLPKAWREHFSDVRVAWGGMGDARRS